MNNPLQFLWFTYSWPYSWRSIICKCFYYSKHMMMNIYIRWVFKKKLMGIKLLNEREWKFLRFLTEQPKHPQAPAISSETMLPLLLVSSSIPDHSGSNRPLSSFSFPLLVAGFPGFLFFNFHMWAHVQLAKIPFPQRICSGLCWGSVVLLDPLYFLSLAWHLQTQPGSMNSSPEPEQERDFGYECL